MPGNEPKTPSCSRDPAEQKVQQPTGGESEEQPKTPVELDGSSHPASSQPAIPFMFGSMSPLLTSSQLQALLLQQCSSKEVSNQILQLVSLTPQLGQHRPSVLRKGTQLPPQSRATLSELSTWSDRSLAHTSKGDSMCKVETKDNVKAPSSKTVHSFQQTSHTEPRRSSPHHKQGTTLPNPNDSPARSVPMNSTALFVNGLCRWPGCEEVFEEYAHFLKHLYRDHSHGDRSIAQWRVQRDIVEHMETQLTMEKQKLLAMQLHLHMSEHRPIDLSQQEDSEGDHGLAISLPQSWVADSTPYSASKETAELVRQGYWHVPTSHLIPELVPSIDCYKYTNIRPPYTYASLIRWAILDSPEKQLTLNEIYHWFTRMFFYFRNNTATWKNAVRHNLSLHKCFVRVEGGKGAVWTVDETEFQRRKGQKFNRDHGMKWLTPYSLFRPQES
ncbi:forkhead box protein P3 [Scleropages formosus]|uniref:Forkhead box P3b n=1 Tax=Scleropages formosus TaxID=113540 RepID=A0A8C9V727_SCLFO|nr:forkhead box protein P3 [Scleropages formosus]